MTQVFISYSRSDMEFVQRLALDLQRAGLDVWWDLSDIQGSDVWEKKIEEGLRSSQYFVVVLTPASLESRWVRREYLSADNSGINIIPLKLKTYDDVPLTLRDIQPIDAIDRAYEDVLSDVLRIVSVKDREESIQSSDLVGAINPKGFIENIYSKMKMLNAPTVSPTIAPIGILDLIGLIIPFVYFVFTGLKTLHLLGGNATSLVWGAYEILTGFYFIFKRQITSGWLMKISLIVFLLAYSVVTYSELTGSNIDFIPLKVEGLSALLIAGLLVANLRSPKKAAPYSSITLAVFLMLVGAKMLNNHFGNYPPALDTYIILSGIITSIVLWLDQ